MDSKLVLLYLFTIFSCIFRCCFSENNLGQSNSFTISSFTYSETKLKPYEWRYIRVDLPQWFSSMTLALKTDVDLDVQGIAKTPKSTLPLICFRDGSPPLPDVFNTSIEVLGPISNGSFEGIIDLQNMEQCYPLQKSILLRLTNEQISPGAWYIGLFNGIGDTRTQSKMITRGSAFSFSGNVSVEGCATSALWGQHCNETIEPLSCAQSGSYNFTNNQTAGNSFSCKSSSQNSCLGDGQQKIYYLEVFRIPEAVAITARNVRFNQTPSNSSRNASDIVLMCYVRYGAMPLATSHDYSGNINEAPLIIDSLKIGQLFIAIEPINLSNKMGGNSVTGVDVCYSMELQMLECPTGKAGLNCSSDRFMLQTVLRKNPSVPFESYYLPIDGKVSSNSANFLLEPLMSNSSVGGQLNDSWSYFLLDIPHGAAGGNFHIRLASDVKVNYEVYVRYGGFPSLHSWDYFYANSTRSSDGSMFFKLYDSTEETVNFYILYAREGSWTFGLRYPNISDDAYKVQTTMSISLERCPRRCSSHGTCQSVVDTSGLTLYSYCSCDRNHGGFDCGVEIVSHKGHIRQSIALIASNAAAILPAFWALRQKAFAEWVLFTSSGISSGLYHACDVGTWCALSFHVLQFLDFWLSFMAVVSTFVYLTTIDETSKRTIHTVVAILTALMAETEATRSSNIVLVIAIGSLGLLVGWLIEFSTNFRSFSFPTLLYINTLERWQAIRAWFENIVRILLKRFRWGFVLSGFTALAMAAISWTLESSESYWIWHSIWHVSIYTSSFFFLCSKANNINDNDQGTPQGVYELTRQDSIPRGE
ncbi:NGX6/PGAP6/MYMK [Dillenia turbinata]|uniref:NGX6/PGAP6/MYMK n=1 Tax=Dillenia turbinata TaxID=194707 RepID=A0AAN8Z2I4_9MAGN